MAQNKIELYVERYVWEFRYNFEVSLLSPTQPEQHLPSLFSRFLIKVGELHLARHFTLPTTSNTPQHNQHNIRKKKIFGISDDIVKLGSRPCPGQPGLNISRT